MKTKLFFAMVIVLICSCRAKVNNGAVNTDLIDPENPPIMTFKDSVFEFGTITEGESVAYSFIFTNTGQSNLVINDVRPSCGCTVPQSWPKHPIRPGEGGKIDIVFNSEGKSGDTRRSIRVTTNGKPTHKALFIHGNIISPK